MGEDILKRIYKLNNKQFERLITIIETVLDIIEEEPSENNGTLEIYKNRKD